MNSTQIAFCQVQTIIWKRRIINTCSICTLNKRLKIHWKTSSKHPHVTKKTPLSVIRLPAANSYITKNLHDILDRTYPYQHNRKLYVSRLNSIVHSTLITYKIVNKKQSNIQSKDKFCYVQNNQKFVFVWNIYRIFILCIYVFFVICNHINS